MIRFPNPGSDIEGAVRIFRDIFGELKSSPDFDLDDVTGAMIKTKNVTSLGAIGEEALRRSTRKDRSRDPLFNQSKAYAEFYRALGLIQSTSTTLRFGFSLLGKHVATASTHHALIRECFLGVAYPSEVLKVKGNNSLRLFAGILRTMASCEGMISKDEIIYGPMNLADDRNPTMFKAMTNEILRLRKLSNGMKSALEEMQVECGITKNTMSNYTRIPIAFLSWTGWGQKKGGHIRLTPSGRTVVERIENAVDVRLSDFRKIPTGAQQPFVRATFFRMLARCGFDTTPIAGKLAEDEAIVSKHFPPDAEWLFSPFQQLPRWELNDAFSMSNEEKPNPQKNYGKLAESGRPILEKPRSILLFELTSKEIPNPPSSDTLAAQIREASKVRKLTSEGIVAFLEKQYVGANQDVFYPIVAECFRILGFNCERSRQGVNYARADAMIKDPSHSIPIEIKSPGEETEISVKGVRQALENKIILLARRAYTTTLETTSLLVGYNRPNERSEVTELVEDIFKTFGIRIGIFDFKTLLHLVVTSVLAGKEISMPDFQRLKGIVDVTRI